MKTYPGLVHANGNLLCSVDWKTTGRRPGYHEIVQLAVVPLNSDLRPVAGIRPFYENIRPQFPLRADRSVMNTHALSLEILRTSAADGGTIGDLFRKWFEALDLPQSKKLMPLAFNWPVKAEFGKSWLGEAEWSAIFHDHYRCSFTAATMVNDVCAFHGEKIPYSFITLKQMCEELGVENLAPHDALSDAIAGAAVYRQLIHMITDLSVV